MPIPVKRLRAGMQLRFVQPCRFVTQTCPSFSGIYDIPISSADGHQHHKDGKDQSGIGRDRLPDPFPEGEYWVITENGLVTM